MIPDRSKRAAATQLVYSKAWNKIMNDQYTHSQSSRLIRMRDYLDQHEPLEEAEAILVFSGKNIATR